MTRRKAGFWRSILTTDDENTIWGIKRVMTMAAQTIHTVMIVADRFNPRVGYFQDELFYKGTAVILGTYAGAELLQHGIPLVAQKIADIKKPDCEEKPS